MARGVPYRRFDNVQKKIGVEEYLGRPVTNVDKTNPDFNRILRTVLNRNIKYGVDSRTHIELEGLKPTLGFEIETVMGRLDPDDYQDLNIKAEHDGSLRGPNREEPTGGEYVTGVLYGDAGFKHLYDICKTLSKHCDVDHRAGVHIHIGSLNWTKEDIVYSYILAQYIENEVFSMLPVSRRNNEYCRKLTRLFSGRDVYALHFSLNKRLEYEVVIDEFYDRIFREVSGGHIESRECNGNTNHPRGSKCGWDKRTQRYCWLNYVTLIFDTKGNPKAKTLEIRNHGATLNYYKIRNWAKIWVAFTEYVSKYKKNIIESILQLNNENNRCNIENICGTIYKENGHKLIKYIQTRKETFSKFDETIDWKSEPFPDKTIKQILEIN